MKITLKEFRELVLQILREDDNVIKRKQLPTVDSYKKKKTKDADIPAEVKPKINKLDSVKVPTVDKYKPKKK